MDLDDPEAVLSQDFVEKMYPNHPYRFPIIGYRDRFLQLTQNSLWDYLKKMYTPANMVLSLAGDLEIDRAADLVETYFGGQQGYEDVPPRTWEDDLGSGWDFPPVSLDLEVPRAKMGFPSCSVLHADGVSLDLIDTLLSYGKNSYFYKKYLADNLLINIETHSWTPTQRGTLKSLCPAPASNCMTNGWLS